MSQNCHICFIILKHFEVNVCPFGLINTDFLLLTQEDNPLKIKSTSLLIAGALLGAAVMPVHASNEAMLDLLKVLRDRGTITAQDYDLLANAAKADKEAGDAVAMKVEKVEKKSASFSNLEWAERIKIKGDMRFRHETENVDDGTSRTNEEDRLRIRARVGVYAQVNDNVKAGIRLVTSSGSATSTNLSLENDFRSTNAGIDLGYIDWAPEMLGGDTNIVVGKMKKQWDSVNDVIWDGDTNPEGAAIKSKIKLSGITLMPSAGYYVLDDNGNDSFSEDSHVGHAQLAAKVGKKTKVGISYYGFENPNNAGESMEERMFEIFGETAIPGTPVTVFASHVTNSNADASGDDDNALSIGAKAKLGNFKLGYEYRDLGVNAVNSNFDNSDFLSDSKGSIFKAAYKIDKNFSVGATYYTSDSNISGDDTEVDLLHLDLKAKF
jgi:hypothetical protein